jgi:hypothetical protein
MELGYSLCCTQVSLICNDKNGCSILQSIDNNNPGKSYNRHSKVLSYDSHSQTIGTFTFIIILMLNKLQNHSTLLVSVQIVNADDLKYTMMSWITRLYCAIGSLHIKFLSHLWRQQENSAIMNRLAQWRNGTDSSKLSKANCVLGTIYLEWKTRFHHGCTSSPQV